MEDPHTVWKTWKAQPFERKRQLSRRAAAGGGRMRLMSRPGRLIGIGAVLAAMLLGPLVLSQAAFAAPPPSGYGLQTTVPFAGSNPQFTAVDPFANVTSSADGLKPARPFWYEVDKTGLTILRLYDNRVVYRVPWPTTTISVVQPDGEFVDLTAPTTWDPVGITVSYPTEEALASNSETPATYVYVVMKHSGYQWRSNPTPPAGQDPNVRDTIVADPNPATDSSMLIQVDVTDPTFSPDVYPTGPAPAIAGALLGHDAGQPAFDPATGNVYVGNMPSTSLPTTPTDLTSFASVIAPLAPPAVEAAGGEAAGAPEPPLVVICGPEHPTDGTLLGAPQVWPCTESGDGPASWEFQGLPSWLHAHADKLTGKLDGLLYGTPDTLGPVTYQARVTDYGEDPAGVTSEWATFSLDITTTAPNEAGEGGFEAGVPGGQPIEGTGTCDPAPTTSPGSMVPNWVDVQTSTYNGAMNGCFVMGTAPISGEYYEFTLPNFHFAAPFQYNPAPVFSGNVAGAYVFDPLPAGVGLSGLAWHEIDKIHDPSTEADILNAEFFGVEPFTGQMYRILPPQGAIEGSGGDVTGPPETSIEPDAVSAFGTPLAADLATARPDIAAALTGNLKVRFGDLVVEASRDPRIFVTASEIADPTGADPTVTPIGGSTIADGAVMKVSGARDTTKPADVTVSQVNTINLPGVQAYYPAVESNLAPAVRGSEPGQTDNQVLWMAGTTTGNVAVIDTATGSVSQTLNVPTAMSLGNVSFDPGVRSAYVAAPSLANVTIFGTGAAAPRIAPTIWGSGLATFNEGAAGSYTVLATGEPVPSLTETGALPSGVTFVDNGDGTATLAGTPAVGTGGDYVLSITATNSVGTATQAFTLTIAAPPTITSPAATTFSVGCAGSFPITVTGTPTLLTVTLEPVTGGQPVPTWLTITQDEETGATTLDGTPPAGSEGTYTFNIRASTGVPPDAVQTFTLTVTAEGTCQAAPVVTTNPANQTVTAPAAATFTAAATGNPTPTVQWQISVDGGATFTNIFGATSTTYNTGATTAAMNGNRFRAVFTNSAGSATTSAAILTVNATTGTAPVVTTQPTSQTVTAPVAATFTSAASGDPAPTVQWQRSTNGGSTWSNIAGATSTTYNTGATNATMNGNQFRAVFTNSIGSATSTAATLTVNSAPVVTAQPTSQTVTAGQTATFTAAASGTPAPTVQWQVSTNGTSFTNIVGATSTSYTTPATSTSMNGYRYRAVFTNSAGSATSNAATLTVNAATTAPSVTTNPSNQTVMAPAAASFESTATGTPMPTVQWQVSANGGSTWSNIAGATSTVYTTGPTTTAMNGNQYRAVFTNSAGSVNSSAATLTVTTSQVPLAVTTTTLPNGSVGQSYSYQLEAQGGTQPYTWSVISANGLPRGIRLSSTGLLSGTPRQSASGTYAFVVQVTDSTGQHATATLTLVIAPRVR